MSFEQAWPYQDDLLALPVSDADESAAWYASHFGLVEVDRPDAEHKTVIMERDGVRFVTPAFMVNKLAPCPGIGT